MAEGNNQSSSLSNIFDEIEIPDEPPPERMNMGTNEGSDDNWNASGGEIDDGDVSQNSQSQNGSASFQESFFPSPGEPSFDDMNVHLDINNMNGQNQQQQQPAETENSALSAAAPMYGDEYSHPHANPNGQETSTPTNTGLPSQQSNRHQYTQQSNPFQNQQVPQNMLQQQQQNQQPNGFQNQQVQQEMILRQQQQTQHQSHSQQVGSQQQQQQQQKQNLNNIQHEQGHQSNFQQQNPQASGMPYGLPVQAHATNGHQPQHQQHGNSNQTPYSTQAQQQFPQPPQPQTDAVIELLDDDDDNDAASTPPQAAGVKRQLPHGPASASYRARPTHTPSWMKKSGSGGGTKIVPGYSIPEYKRQQELEIEARAARKRQLEEMKSRQLQPIYIDIPGSFTPTWENPLPAVARHTRSQEVRYFELSLLNVQEFTITGLPTTFEGPPSSVAGLRKTIREISRDYGKATFEREGDEGGGRWRIPLGAYPAFFAYLNRDPMCKVEGIPTNQLKIASLGRARLEKGYPSAIKLVNAGVPKGLANALAPFQRGGVDFVIDKDGRAMIADDMGLGKTIQAVACMSVYHKEWPVLVLTPSTARYHWEAEFQQWLCKNSPVNLKANNAKPLPEMQKIAGEDNNDDDKNPKEEEEIMDETKCMPLLRESQIHVLTSSKDDILPSEHTRVVVCSYGLAPLLVNNNRIRPGLFQCAIVDESHMLKNINSKRTAALVPVLHATNRCVLLSGTPALARPSELWPQLKILGTEKKGWWSDEGEFYRNYVRRTSAVRRAELHALLTGTVMIRRMKSEILKSMLPKRREKAVVDVSTNEHRKEFHRCMESLRQGKGILGKLARQHTALGSTDDAPALDPSVEGTSQLFQEEVTRLKQQCASKVAERLTAIQQTVLNYPNQLNSEQRQALMSRMENEMRREVDVYYRENFHKLQQNQPNVDTPVINRKTVLNHMYTLTAKAKLPLIVDMVKRWLSDPTKGKLCLFAHHIFVLDEIIKQVGLSNAPGSQTKYIRIDGSTTPKYRQQQITAFQNDPGVQIAVLGITAAGVAVTLTASSTVWFTELFWTPALMIQAEDRCHRIGQNSRVRCLYLVATGTLDDLLWKLLEKKFQDLGEFVEGKEKLNIVVHQFYNGVKELHSQYFTSPSDDDSDDGLQEDEDVEGDRAELLKLEHDLENDINLLAKEEMTSMLPDGDEDEMNGDVKVEEVVSESKPPPGTLGSSEAEAICLSDDDDEGPPKKVAAVKAPVSEPNKGPTNGQAQVQDGMTTSAPDVSGPFHNARLYKLLFEGPSYGMQLIVYHHRLVVSRKISQKQKKPAVGDIVIGVNGARVPFISSLSDITPQLKALLAKSPVELTFLEVDSFTRFFGAGAGGSEDAIVLLDDD